MPKLKLGELCAGYGGLGLAVEEVFDAELAWYSEFDAAPSKIMATHWPDITNHGDMTQIDWANIEPVDIISGGTPCQDLSAAGRRKGMTEGTRSNLWVHMREAVAIIKPKFVVWENVRGAYSAKATSDLEHCPGCMGASGGANEHVLRALGRVLGDLHDLGYDCQWRGLRAADVGAPHGRYRVFIVATRRGVAANPVGFGGNQAFKRDGSGTPDGDGASFPNESDRDTLRLRSNRETTADTEHHGHVASPGGRSDGTAVAPGARPASVAPKEHGESTGGHFADSESGLLQASRPEVTSDSNGGHDARREQDQERGKVERAAAERAGGDVHGSDAIEWGDYAPAIRRWETVRGTAPAPTELTAKGKHRLSARFAEWMMGIPAGWVTDVDISRNDQLKAIGNGVVPQQAIAAIRDMLIHLEEESEAPDE